MSILTVGTLALDNIETPWEKAERVLGGSAVYISLAARQLSVPVGMVAIAGKDFPEEYREFLQKSDLDLTGMQTSEDQDTFSWGGRYGEDLNTRDTIFTHLNALEEFHPVIPDAYRNSKVFCIGNLSPKTQQDTLNQVSASGFVACDTMNYWIENTPEELKNVLARIDCLLINDEEARQITGEHNLRTAAQQVLARGPGILIIKKGEHGAMLFVEDKVFIAPGFPLENVRDPTGAGDAFLGAFAGSLVHERHIGLNALKRAVVYGATVASFCVEALGPYTMGHIPRKTIEERAKFFRGLTEWPQLHESIEV